MAEELFQFLLKLKESGVDLTTVSVWSKNCESFWIEFRELKYKEDYKEIELS